MALKPDKYTLINTCITDAHFFTFIKFILCERHPYWNIQHKLIFVSCSIFFYIPIRNAAFQFIFFSFRFHFDGFASQAELQIKTRNQMNFSPFFLYHRAFFTILLLLVVRCLILEAKFKCVEEDEQKKKTKNVRSEAETKQTKANCNTLFHITRIQIRDGEGENSKYKVKSLFLFLFCFCVCARARFANKLAQRYWTNIMANLMEKDRYSVKSQCFINGAFGRCTYFAFSISLTCRKMHGSMVFHTSSFAAASVYCTDRSAAVVHFNFTCFSLIPFAAHSFSHSPSLSPFIAGISFVYCVHCVFRFGCNRYWV